MEERNPCFRIRVPSQNSQIIFEILEDDTSISIKEIKEYVLEKFYIRPEEQVVYCPYGGKNNCGYTDEYEEDEDKELFFKDIEEVTILTTHEQKIYTATQKYEGKEDAFRYLSVSYNKEKFCLKRHVYDTLEEVFNHIRATRKYADETTIGQVAFFALNICLPKTTCLFELPVDAELQILPIPR
jgi:hypothetical protein